MDGLNFAISKWGEFGQIRYQATLVANEIRRIPIIVPAGKSYYVFKYRFGSFYAQNVLITDVLNFRFSGVMNYFEQNILIGTELLNFVTEPEPYIAITGSGGAIVVQNTDVATRNFSIVLDYIMISNEIAEEIREIIIGKREVVKGKIGET